MRRRGCAPGQTRLGSASCGIDSLFATIGRTGRDTFGHNNDKPNSSSPGVAAILPEFTKASPYPETRSDTRQTEESGSRRVRLSVTANIVQSKSGACRITEFASVPVPFTRADRQAASHPPSARPPPAPRARSPELRSPALCKSKVPGSQHDWMISRYRRNEQSWVPNVYRQHRRARSPCYRTRGRAANRAARTAATRRTPPLPTGRRPSWVIRTQRTTLALRAPIAQLVELRTFNPQVVGSSPTGGTPPQAPGITPGACGVSGVARLSSGSREVLRFSVATEKTHTPSGFPLSRVRHRQTRGILRKKWSR